MEALYLESDAPICFGGKSQRGCVHRCETVQRIENQYSGLGSLTPELDTLDTTDPNAWATTPLSWAGFRFTATPTNRLLIVRIQGTNTGSDHSWGIAGVTATNARLVRCVRSPRHHNAIKLTNNTSDDHTLDVSYFGEHGEGTVATLAVHTSAQNSISVQVANAGVITEPILHYRWGDENRLLHQPATWHINRLP